MLAWECTSLLLTLLLLSVLAIGVLPAFTMLDIGFQVQPESTGESKRFVEMSISEQTTEGATSLPICAIVLAHLVGGL